MQQCGTVIQIQDQRESREDKALFLATEKWLLPKYDGEIAGKCEAVFDVVAAQRGGTTLEVFSFEEFTISEFGFRSLMVHLGKLLKTRAIFFRNGLQATGSNRVFHQAARTHDDSMAPAWCFQVRWIADSHDDFFGRVDARLAAAQRNIHELAQQIEEAFRGEGSPLANATSFLRRESHEMNCFSHCYFRELRDTDFDVAISYSGRDKDIVQPLIQALVSEGNRVYEYMIEECRYGDYRKVRHFMEGLRNPQCLLLFLSDNYLRNEPENWYCLWEFADAVNRLKSGERSEKRLVVTYRKGGYLTSRNIPETALSALTAVGEHFQTKCDEMRKAARDLANDYRNRADHFFNGAENLSAFAESRGDDGAYSHYTKTANGDFDFSEILRDVAAGLREPRVSH